MHLLIGPPGAGKSHAIFRAITGRLEQGRADFRLLVPTAAQAARWRQHLAWPAMRLAAVTTLSGFIQEHAYDLPQISGPRLHLMVSDILAELQPASFRAVMHTHGFRSALVHVLQEFFAAEATGVRLEHLLAQGVLHGERAADFCAIFAALEAHLSRHRLGMRNHRLQRAADLLKRRRLRGLEAIYLDGFTSFTVPELELIDALAQQVEVTVTLPEWPGAEESRQALLSRGFDEQCLSRQRPVPAAVVVPAPGLEQEAAEIARRIVAAQGQGIALHDIAVIVRNPHIYAPVLRAAFERFSIPARFLLTEPLPEHPLIQYLLRLADALLSGWNHEKVLLALAMPSSGVGGTERGDRFLNLIRAARPQTGWRSLWRAAQETGLQPVLERLRPLDDWLGVTASPLEWTRRTQTLTSLCAWLPQDGPANHTDAVLWRSRAAALSAFAQAMSETGRLLPADRLFRFDQFWRQALVVLSLTACQTPDTRRNALRVMSAQEARDWEAPLVFLCGMLEGQFPVQHVAEPIFSEEVRQRLQQARLRVETAADRQEQEQLLFTSAAARATQQLVLSYPAADTRGNPQLRSFFLDSLTTEQQAAVPVLPRPHRQKPPPRRFIILDDQLREELRQRHSTLRPTAVESFLQCRFQFFGRHTLNMASAPAPPDGRLDVLVQGSILHDAIARWHREPDSDPTALFEEVFELHRERVRAPYGYRTELVRLTLLRDFLAFVEQSETGQSEIRTEEAFELVLPGGLIVHGRIDRYDVDAQGHATVYDYKYSSEASVRRRVQEQEQGRYVQGGLYLLALERQQLQPAGFHYFGLRNGLSQRGWSEPGEVRRLMEEARAATLRVAQELQEGRIDIHPTDPQACGFCELRDACRVRWLPRTLTLGETL